MSYFFVAGTDTNVGKTIASRAIMQALQQVGVPIVGYKPIAYNQDTTVYTDQPVLTNGDYDALDNPDVLILQASSAVKLPYEQMNSYTIAHSVPVLTPEYNQISIEKMDQDLARLTQNHSSVLVEGAFGWLTPIKPEYSFADWVKTHKMPVVLVVGIKDGCINHALLTANTTGILCVFTQSAKLYSGLIGVSQPNAPSTSTLE